MSILRKTQSLCPQCLRVIDAHYISKMIKENEWIFIHKTCPEHGSFSAPIWVNLPNIPSFNQWYINTGKPSHPTLPLTKQAKGCPYDCGLCPEHSQHTCCALLEVTTHCNLHCPICYANSNIEHNNKKNKDASLEELSISLEKLMQHSGSVNVQLSGGEPTVRQDLPQIITLTKGKGFNFVQLNTNGLRLGNEESYAKKLKDAGLSLVYLQYDDTNDATYLKLRGKACAKDKEQALQNCIKAGLSVVLVVTIVKGVNHMALGNIIQKAIEYGPLVRGIHLQPVSSFGRFPWDMESTGSVENITSTDNEYLNENSPRITIAEVLYHLESQTKGMIKAEHFQPPRSEHPLCSFNTLYQRQNDKLIPNKNELSNGNCCGHTPCNSQNNNSNISMAKKAQEFVAQHWGPLPQASEQTPNKFNDFDNLLNKIQYRFTISGMAFQDAYSLDLERLRRCHVHIISPDNNIIPFCAYNLTSNEGFSLYRHINT